MCHHSVCQYHCKDEFNIENDDDLAFFNPAVDRLVAQVIGAESQGCKAQLVIAGRKPVPDQHGCKAQGSQTRLTAARVYCESIRGAQCVEEGDADAEEEEEMENIANEEGEEEEELDEESESEDPE